MYHLRRAIPDDLSSIHSVWWAADPLQSSIHNPWFGHVLRTGKMMVAVADPNVVGFAGVRAVAGNLVVSDFFVHPQHQDKGIGTRLLDQLLPQDQPVMTLASSDPKASSVYSRFGMARQWECHYLKGDPQHVDRPGWHPSEVGRYPISASDLVHLRDGLDCRFLESGSAAVAVSTDSIESSRVASPTEAVEPLGAVLGWMADRGNDAVSIHLAEEHPIFPVLIGAGFQVTATDTLMASEGAEVPDPGLLTFNGDILRIDR